VAFDSSNVMADGRGLPLLSGPPITHVDRAEIACRKCNKEFNVIFTRARKCNHCGMRIHSGAGSLALIAVFV
jgi:rRNA maturation endonuclease Nob1